MKAPQWSYLIEGLTFGSCYKAKACKYMLSLFDDRIWGRVYGENDEPLLQLHGTQLPVRSVN